VGRGISAPPGTLDEAVLGTPPPSPTSDLLSAKNAKERLRDVGEGFFFRILSTEDENAIRQVVEKNPAWAGSDEAPYFAEFFR
jgi:hypothetical protein